ncbi:MAG: type II secretion system F family protein [Nanoarchaeota archaeon]|nr:type II secretion system F family protein [Nanoarchaeota archaeon]
MANPFKILKKINKSQIIGLVIAFIIIILSLLLLQNSPNLLYFLLGISFFIGGLPFFISLIIESNRTREKDEMFMEFSRNLVESVNAGTPISKSILNVKNKNYGSLNPYIEKLANQISLGIPIKTSLETFARDVGSATISRAITIISESEKAGGEIQDILESVATSVAQIEKLRKERRAAMYTLVVQGYIIFLIFIVIMLVMQFKILPIAANLGQTMAGGDSSGMGGIAGILGGSAGQVATPEQLARPFLWLLIVQGFFAGLVIGKLAEGEVKLGLKHSFVLLVLALLINTGAKLIIG